MTITDKLKQFLEAKGIAFEVTEHEAVYTSEQAAAVRGTTLASGAKALILKAQEAYLMVVLAADRKLDSKKLKGHLACRSLRFASREEVDQLTGLQPGSIPPFGSLFGLITKVDRSLTEQSIINFNAADHRISISMTFQDYLIAEKPEIVECT